jgi:hypothetical protein
MKTLSIRSSDNDDNIHLYITDGDGKGDYLLCPFFSLCTIRCAYFDIKKCSDGKHAICNQAGCEIGIMMK